MHSSRIAILSIPTLLLLPAFAMAQDEATSSSSALIITTDDAMVARGVQSMFGGTGALPKPGEGAAYVLSLDDGGKVIAGEGAAKGWLTIDARPAQLMKIFKQQVTRARMMGSMMGGMALSQMGVDSAEVDDIVEAVFAFPNQVDTLHIAMPAKPEKGKPIALDLDLGPVAKTGFADLVTALHPHPQGLRHLPDDGAMLTMNADIELSSILPIVTPLLQKFTTMMIADEDLRKQAVEMYAKFYPDLAGPMSMSMDQKSGMRMLAELVDGKAIATIMEDPLYAKIAQEAGSMGGAAKLTIEPKAFEHRGVSLTKSSVEMEDTGEPNPFMKDGKSVNLGGVVGSAMISVGMNAGEDDAKVLVDSILDNKLKRSPLGKGNTLMTMGIDLTKFGDMIAETTGNAPEGEMPARADMSMQKNDKGLHIEVRIK